MKNENGVYGIVLASGLSARMGKPKLLLHWKGSPILEHTLAGIVDIPFAGVKVVIPHNAESLKGMVDKYNFETVINHTPSDGLGSSLALALQYLPRTARAVMIILGDQPTMNSEDIYKVWFTFNQLMKIQSDCPKTIIQMKYQDGKVGHPVLFSQHFFQELKTLHGDNGGKEIIKRNSQFLKPCYSKNKYPNDIDTPTDYERLLKVKVEGEI